MPEVEHDHASPYIVAHGVIRASNDSESWVNAFKGDIISFFVGGLSTSAGSLLGSLNLSADGGTLQIRSTAQTNFRFDIHYDERNNCIVKLKWGNLHEHILIDNFNPSNKHPIYWVIYKGVARTGRSDTEMTTGYAPDIMVTMARDNSKTLTGSVSSYTPPTDEEWETIFDNMCKYTPASFMIVNVLNSLTNNMAGAGIVSLVCDLFSPSELWQESTLWEPGYCIVPNKSSGHRIQRYYSEPHVAEPNIPKSILFCGDTPYYPLPDGSNSYGFGMISNQFAPIFYRSPMWSPASACITVNSLRQVWGNRLDPNGVEMHVPHVGPELIHSDDGYYLRCYDMWMPVAPPSEN